MKKALKFLAFCAIIFWQNSYSAEDDRSLEELKECPCVQEYVLRVYGDDITVAEKKKGKKTKKSKKKKTRSSTASGGNDDYQYDNENSENGMGNGEEGTSRKNSRKKQSSKSSGRNRNSSSQGKKQRNNTRNGNQTQRKTSNRSNSSNNGSNKSWMDETAMLPISFMKSMPMLAQNEGEVEENRSIEILKDINIKAENTNYLKYRINDKESIKFRKELEKYRQELA